MMLLRISPLVISLMSVSRMRGNTMDIDWLAYCGFALAKLFPAESNSTFARLAA